MITLNRLDRRDDFDNFFRLLIGNEGDLSKDRYDVGGDTIFGISVNNFPDAYYRVIEAYNRGDRITAVSLARDFYRVNFWNENYCRIPDDSLAFKIADLGVNIGKDKVIKALQNILNQYFGFKLVVDGAFGINTLSAVRNVDQDCLYKRLIEWADAYYKKRRTAWRHLKGWLNRLFRRENI